MKLVIVESPAKARSLRAFLGKDYAVEASVGHIRDLPQPSELPADMKKGPYGKFAVDVDGGFTPYYTVYPDKKKKVTELRKLLKEADELYLATDEDREGEAIAWHLLQVLKPKVPVKRMVFHEITKEAIEQAARNTRNLDEDLVDAQETRRILDRLVGYEVSPLLWRKVGAGLSAGRVQSVVTRMVVQRERERMAFRPASYWDVTATFTAPQAAQAAPAGGSFTARLTSLDGARVATGKDFADDATVRTKNVVVLTEQTAQQVAAATTSGRVSSLETKPYRRRPAAPFTTSTLQQEASRKLRLSSRETMRVAQSLYENGFITYMRTDSVALSQQAITAARAQATKLYGADSIPAKPRVYGTVAKGAQEAHEAIRPAGESFRRPAETGLTGAEARLYELIWKRTIASQMNDATGSTATVKVEAALTSSSYQVGEYVASGTVITDRGFLAAYEEGRDQDRYQSDDDARLPRLEQGEALAASDVVASGHETTPPPRYTEASLVKAMEELQIGRPSTYAATISTIMDRGYVRKKGQALVPSWLAFAVTRLLEENLPRLVDYDFTAAMEGDLDKIARGQEDSKAWLGRFYFGDGAAGESGAESSDGAAGGSGAAGHPGLKNLVEGLGDIDARAVNTVPLGDGIFLRVGRYGPYLETEVDGEVKRASVPDEVAPDELTLAKAHELLEAGGADGRELGVDPVSGHAIVAKNGRFGPYVTEVLPEGATGKPRTGSLFKSMQLETIGLEDALRLLSLPRVVGVAADGTEITAQNGRYGPYLKKGTETRSLASEDAIFDVSLAEAEELFAQPKTRGRGAGRAAVAPLREFGADPVSGKPVVVKDGRFGPYVTDGEVNATVPRGEDPAGLTEERAFELLAIKRAKGPAPKRGGARGGAGKTAGKTTGKARAAKASAAKAPTKKAAAKAGAGKAGAGKAAAAGKAGAKGARAE